MTDTPEAVIPSAPQKAVPPKPVKTVDKAATQAVVKPFTTKDAKAAPKPVVKAPKAAPKTVPKVTPKAVAKAAPKVAATPVVNPKANKPAKPKKAKLVRDSFTIPKTEYVVLEELKLRAIKLASPIKKTELIRAGIKALAAMSDTGLLAALKAVPAIKTGRPAKS
ncbi:MAG TPA: hypothetical protein VIM63_07180 [Rhodoferax sp.]